MKKIIRNFVKGTALVFVALFVVMSAAPVQGYSERDRAEEFSKAELTQMLAPIALYPDSLLAQILMASTYPLEIVEAERWMTRNNNPEGDRLYSALLEKDWDTSVKSLCNFPDVLSALSDKLDQTRKLGDAFLGQEEEVIDVVQELRDRAYKEGNLKSNREQKVIVERKIIRIEPVVSSVVYVPVYDPLYVYGRWSYPAYRPYYWYSPPGFAFGARYVRYSSPFYISIGWFSWTSFDWPNFSIYIVLGDACRYHRPVVHRYYDEPHWRHDTYHRRGVDYRDRDTRDRFEKRPPSLVLKNPVPRISPPDERHKGPDSPDEDRGGDRDNRRERPESNIVQPAPPKDEPYAIIKPLIPDEDNRDEKKPSRGKPENVIVKPEPSRDKPSVIAKPGSPNDRRYDDGDSLKAKPEKKIITPEISRETKDKSREKSPEVIDDDSYDGRTFTRDRDNTRGEEVKVVLGKMIERAADAFQNREKPQEREKSGHENRKGKGGRR